MVVPPLMRLADQPLIATASGTVKTATSAFCRSSCAKRSHHRPHHRQRRPSPPLPKRHPAWTRPRLEPQPQAQSSPWSSLLVCGKRSCDGGSTRLVIRSLTLPRRPILTGDKRRPKADILPTLLDGDGEKPWDWLPRPHAAAVALPVRV